MPPAQGLTPTRAAGDPPETELAMSSASFVRNQPASPEASGTRTVAPPKHCPQGACRLLLERITQRGFAPPPRRRLLVIRDDAKALKKAVSRMWPDAVQQECLVRAERVTLAKLPHKAKEEAVRLFRRLFAARGKAAGIEAFEALVAHVSRHNDEAAACLRERKGGLLTFPGLDVSAELNKVFLSTNMIENVIRNLRLAAGSIKRWKTNRGSDMVSRWMTTGWIRAEHGFRRVHGYHRLGELAFALGRDRAAPPASAPTSCAPAGVAAERTQTPLESLRNLPYIHHLPINQPS